jgi:hypothetical protein
MNGRMGERGERGETANGRMGEWAIRRTAHCERRHAEGRPADTPNAKRQTPNADTLPLARRPEPFMMLIRTPYDSPANLNLGFIQLS